MRIEMGLFDHIVLQRVSERAAGAVFSGESRAAGAVQARVTKTGKPLPGLNWKNVGRARRGKMKGKIGGLPVGGPYDVRLRVVTKNGEIGDSLRVKDVAVGDVWVAAGQSNMQGCGLRAGAAKPHPMVRAFYMDDRWATAKDPIHNLWACVDKAHIDLGASQGIPNTVTGVGPAVSFGLEMRRRTGVPQGILACAHGGTTMTQWDPKLKKMGGSSLYGATLRRVRKNGGRIAGVIWYQGESDAYPNGVALYTERMKELVRSFRRDTRNARLPFVAVQIGRVVRPGPDDGSWNALQERQRLLPEAIRRFSLVPAADLTLDDSVHISGAAQRRLGKRLAYAMDALTRGPGAGKPPLALREARIVRDSRAACGNIVLKFDNVVGRLCVPEGVRPAGFSVNDSSPDMVIFDAQLCGDTVVLRANLPPLSLEGRALYHGFGTDPYCNITDKADRLIPVMGPIRLGETRAVTPMVTRMRVALPVNLPERDADYKLNGLSHPGTDGIARLQWREMTFADRFCDLHLEIAPLRPQQFVVYFACRIDAPEKMKLAACLGYDGPVKLWIDGKELFHDPNGTNPATEDASEIPFFVAPGAHDVLAALGSNACNAWGIYLRFARLDVSATLLRLGPTAYLMPTVTL